MNSALHDQTIAKELKISDKQVAATVSLLDDGATVPFLSRYRKEVTGGLDEVVITAIRDRIAQLRELDKRRDVILASLEEQGKLTDVLQGQVHAAATMTELEDIYLPFRPKRRTRAMIAKERGLEPLALSLWAQETQLHVETEAKKYLNPELSVETVEDALAGARDIMAEWISEDLQARASMRALYLEQGIFKTTAVRGKDVQASKYRDYVEWEEPVAKAPSHRVLAMRRGETEGFLSFRVMVPEPEALSILHRLFLKGKGPASEQVTLAIKDSFTRLLSLSMETETRLVTKTRADQTAIEVFAQNVQQLLMAPPLGQKTVLAIDPGFRTGCKMVCLDRQGTLRHTETIFPHLGASGAAKAGETVVELCQRFQVEAIAVGNGTAGRETEAFLRALKLPTAIPIVMVNESGASVYSASPVAREEFPDHDVTVRGAVSIGRRLMDPLAELVKIDPKAIGVGQYQHDVDQGILKQRLQDVVISCVNRVGVDVNMASPQLLTAVSGVGPQLATNIVAYRQEHGPFSSRTALKKVPRLGAKAFEQAAGFLRITDGEHPLDASAVHPERYAVVNAMAKDLGCTVKDLMKDPARQRTIDLNRYITEDVGKPTLMDILTELAKPGRDPRQQFEAVKFDEGVQSIEQVTPGMILSGVVTNVTAFGAFVDIGVHQDGLVHISQLANKFVSDPNTVVQVNQQVKVTVLEVDVPRKRISLSMKAAANGKS
ncbi:Tex family protein [Candidatus Nitrospira allomarina]|uniref:Tex family protein n=1 Tax=Candidatus Nitrospira allomarina TaxID=3020900 RepID=A0AA96G986_9BACT|nr:Tex family protein [Candidatus Nitrospira allomarina]WNM57503.1 Tex family protein [Candidatus Nitrospira allomarina]